jgi:hypothetical protein
MIIFFNRAQNTERDGILIAVSRLAAAAVCHICQVIVNIAFIV